MSKDYQPPLQSDERRGPPLTGNQKLMGAMVARLALINGGGRGIFIPKTEIDNIRGFLCHEAETPRDGPGYLIEVFTTSELAARMRKEDEEK